MKSRRILPGRYSFNMLIVCYLAIHPVLAANGLNPRIQRGELLYENHCEKCHTQQIHWRDKALVTDWKSLVDEVSRWQRESGLEWNKSDIDEVSRYLNEQFYHYR